MKSRTKPRMEIKGRRPTYTTVNVEAHPQEPIAALPTLIPQSKFFALLAIHKTRLLIAVVLTAVGFTAVGLSIQYFLDASKNTLISSDFIDSGPVTDPIYTNFSTSSSSTGPGGSTGVQYIPTACDLSPCGVNGVCTVLSVYPFYDCECDPFYHSSNTSLPSCDLNACGSQNSYYVAGSPQCNFQGICVFNPLIPVYGYDCSCYGNSYSSIPGKPGCDVNACGLSNTTTTTTHEKCNHRGRCSNFMGGDYACLCQVGFTSSNSSLTDCAISPCGTLNETQVVNSELCSHRGTCRISNTTSTGRSCLCNTNFGGPTCEGNSCGSEGDEPVPNSPACNSRGTCHLSNSTANGKQCECNSGMSGLSCEINPCGTLNNDLAPNSVLCGGHGTCAPTSSSIRGYACFCNDFYSSSNQVSGICDLNPCGGFNSSSVTNSSKCGYDGTCVPNSAGEFGYSCNCDQGHSGTYCAINPCGSETQNSVPNSERCNNHGTCNVAGNSHTCECEAGWSGANCTVNPCGSTTQTTVFNSSFCTNRGSCVVDGNEPTGRYCNCDSGYTSANCSVNPCLSSTSTTVTNSSLCNNRGMCTVSGSSYACGCDSGYSGTTCGTNPCGVPISQSSTPNSIMCHSKGTCTVSGSSPVCTCNAGYSDTTCGTNPCGAATGTSVTNSPKCGNKGTCSESGSNFQCTCNTDYYTSTCGTCSTSTSLFRDTCTCAYNSAGTSCNTYQSPCTVNNPCLNGGTCSTPGAGQTSCACTSEFTGAQCQTCNPCRVLSGSSYLTYTTQCGNYYNTYCSATFSPSCSHTCSYPCSGSACYQNTNSNTKDCEVTSATTSRCCGVSGSPLVCGTFQQ